ncbi:hypothetical protein SDC9_172167 [bioreactor metagenome]|uniref:Uncharacterized protein n=1 Tax=bioreactor metagenome TaxID=1076179 RepID=A0A645GDL6_9ZZZZ
MTRRHPRLAAWRSDGTPGATRSADLRGPSTLHAARPAAGLMPGRPARRGPHARPAEDLHARPPGPAPRVSARAARPARSSSSTAAGRRTGSSATDRAAGRRRSPVLRRPARRRTPGCRWCAGWSARAGGPDG